jgi:hypothetical protein
MVAMVTNGRYMFVLVRTEESESVGMPAAHDRDLWKLWFKNAIHEAVQEVEAGVRRRPPITRSGALGANLTRTNIRICARLKLGYYGGPMYGPRAGKLTLIL